MNSISPNLNLMIKACEKASKILIRDFGELENLQVSKKGPKDFVTNSDKKTEKVLINELTKNKKKYSILSEEIGFIKNDDNDYIWVIDPIDGTTNFLHGIPHFCISIGLKFRDEIISGIIFDPIKNETFYAEKNQGAFFNNHRIRVSKRKNLDECLFATNKNGLSSTDLNSRIFGSAALDLAYVASGRIDGYFQNGLNLWDIAAGTLIVKEAGGIVNNYDLEKTNNIKLVASSEIINEKMLKRLNKF
tara:strand:+ start:760 stop:1500 length:741 start_codon:yes stop_codon:yes gene_type:complete